MPMYRQSWSEADRPWSTREANHFSAFIIRNHFLYPQDLTRSNIRNKVAFIRICFTRDMQECLETKIIQVAGQLRAAGLQSISFIHLMQIGNQRYQVRIPKVPKESQDSGLNQGF